MINLKDPLAVLATQLPWAQIEASLAPKFELTKAEELSEANPG